MEQPANVLQPRFRLPFPPPPPFLFISFFSLKVVFFPRVGTLQPTYRTRSSKEIIWKVHSAPERIRELRDPLLIFPSFSPIPVFSLLTAPFALNFSPSLLFRLRRAPFTPTPPHFHRLLTTPHSPPFFPKPPSPFPPIPSNTQLRRTSPSPFV